MRWKEINEWAEELEAMGRIGRYGENWKIREERAIRSILWF